MSPLPDLARGWLGTPFCHRAALRGVGCDCLGLVLGIWREAGLPMPSPPVYAPGHPDARLLDTITARLPRREGVPQPGDLLLFRLRAEWAPGHLGVLTDDAPQRPRFIHAYSGHGVVESHLTAPWARRLEGAFVPPDAALCW